jgi:beta-lactamase class A
MKEDLNLTQKIKKIIENLGLKQTEISFAVINLKKIEPEISGYNLNNFIYPASIYKVFVAAEILRQINRGQRKLEDIIEITSPNEVDKNVRFFPTATHKDYRPILKNGDKVSLDYLLNLMLTRSDNTAANVLIDVAGRENVNTNIILPNGWQGSDVTRKFLDRLKEKGEYRTSKITVSNGRHLAELFYKIENKTLINPWVSEKLKEYMMKWNRYGRQGLSLSEFKSYYRKGGWLEINGYKWNIYRGIKAVFKKGFAVIKYSGDVGVVKGNNSHYVIAVLTILKTKWPCQKFNLTKLSREIYRLMEGL